MNPGMIVVGSSFTLSATNYSASAAFTVTGRLDMVLEA